jgi:uncharacterized protein
MGTNRIAESLGYADVRLKESMFRKQVEQTSQYLLDVPLESWLYGFRRRAGRPTPGKELFGWYGHGIFHVFGQILGAHAKLYAGSGDQRLFERASQMMDGWAECIEPDGYCFYCARGKVNDLHYEYDKLLGGLLDMFEFAGVREALELASRITEWAVRNLDRNITQKFKQPTGVNFTFYREWYTLSENLFRAFELSQDERYLAFARTWEYPEYWNRFLDESSSMEPCHAYSHVNTLCGAARAYRVTGESRYLSVIEGAYRRIYPEHVYATGGYGPAEGLFGTPGYLGRMILKYPENGFGNAEIPCGTWAVFKLSGYLMEFTRRAGSCSWAERLIYNGIGSELPMHAEGRVMYYANYHVDGTQKAVEFEMTAINTTGTVLEWPCCSGTFPQTVAEYPNLIGYRSSNGLDICQYIPCSLRWNAELSFEIDTDYPLTSQVLLRARCSRPTQCVVRFRVPEWVGDPGLVTVDGKPANSQNSGDGWIRVDRQWKEGERVELQIPLRLRFEAVDRQKPDVCALCFGPVVLAANRPGVFQADALHPELWIRRVEGSLTFHTVPGAVKGYPQMEKVFRPFWEYGLGERYHLYNKVERALSWV